ncbi:hypothetical protein OH76DRAFT_1395141 [Lentinus brumalis]|uniref:Uncharacterized protein n=1 Tax=Lentinus brumalis TaxID=2498619 RepID=A0A371DXT1_9APHY|nr:hypothetical protein OH76DRAFT_1395141 [Polyporus brumalis]
MQFSTLLTLAGVALSATLGASAAQDAHLTTLWVPTATVVATNTFTATRIEQVWTTVAPYEWETTFPVTWTATQTQTQFKPVVTVVPNERRHPRDFELS